MSRVERAVGVVVGSAVGDALGAPFEFGPPGAFSARFPDPGGGGEMCGGGGWEPGEATDDTQMAVLVADSLLQRGDLDLPDVFAGAVRAAIDLGGDTDTVAAVTGGLAGARYGSAAIPARWTDPLHVPLPGSGERVLRLPELVALARGLVAAGARRSGVSADLG
ncbi:ADP-ribosylglycohydrolase family protein [Streptomyces sp. NPDC058171]